MYRFYKYNAVLISFLALMAIYSSMQQWQAYSILKPLNTLIILVIPWVRGTGVSKNFRKWMFLGLVFCLAGDVFLLWDSFFLFGLGAFLVAHLLFALAFTKHFGFTKHLGVLLVILSISAVIYGFFWPHLYALKGPVLGYMLAIAFMTWQGVGAHFKHANATSRLVTLGAISFMLSDSLLGYNKFVSPLPCDSLWVLSSYWFAIYCLAKATIQTAIRAPK